MIEIKAPDDSQFESFTKIFLAGSIEMGKAEKWQDKLATDLQDKRVILFNPRRDDWDSSWVQDPTEGTQFHQQVSWELEHINRSDLVVFYFDPETQSPITLMELGYCIGMDKPMVICCPDGYFRKGNVVITAGLVGAEVTNTYEEFLGKIEEFLGFIEQDDEVEETSPEEVFDENVDESVDSE